MNHQIALTESMQKFLDSEECYVSGLHLAYDQNGYWLMHNGQKYESSDSRLILSAAKKYAEESIKNV